MEAWYIRQAETLTPAALSLVHFEQYRGGVGGEHRHANWVLDYSFEDFGLFRAGSRMRDFAPRQARVAHLYPPGTPYWEDVRGMERPKGTAWMIFRGAEALRLAGLVDSAWGFAEIADPEGELGAAMTEAVRATLAAGEEEGFFEAQAGMYRIARILSRASRSATGGEPPWRYDLGAPAGGDGDWLRRARNLIARNPAAPLDLAGLASRMHCSRSGFSHRFRRLSGETPGDYRMRLRINAASLMLADHYTLREIAGRTGFHDEFHFSKAFKNATGHPPSAFRRAPAP